MSRKKYDTDPQAEALPEQESVADAESPPPQGITVRRFEGTERSHFHRNRPEVKRIDPESLKIPCPPECGLHQHHDPFLLHPDEKTVMQVRVDHAAELLECDEITGGTSRWDIATEEQIAAYQAAQKRLYQR